MKFSWLIFSVLLLLPALARAGDVVVGVNLVNEPDKQTVPEQETTLGNMQKAGVHVIRAGIGGNERGLDFVQRAYAHKIKIEWLVDLDYKGTPWPSRPKGYSGAWPKNPGLSYADPDGFRTYFKTIFDKLEEKGIVLAAFELGNEINWSNADLSFPGHGKVLDENALLNDPEGQRVARGYLQYLKSLTILKELRDHSKWNQHTPIISAGLADLNDSSKWLRSVKADAVGVGATLDFLRAHGLDRLVDGYGLHFYPMASNPGTAQGAAARQTHLQANGLTETQPSGSASGKPCWITEWNFNGMKPGNDATRTLLVREMRGDFSRLAQQGRLKGFLFYTWQGNLHASRQDFDSAFLNGALTESGRLAIAPMEAP